MSKKPLGKPGSETDIKTLLEGKPKRTKQACERLRQLFQPGHRRTLEWWWDVGTHVETLCPKDEARRYRDKIVRRISDSLRPGESTDFTSVLYQARNLVKRFRPRDIKRFSAKIKDASHPMSERHVLGLLAVHNDKTLRRLAEECIKERWSAAKLRRKVQNARGYKSSRGGKRPRPPEEGTLPVAVRDVVILSRRWLAYAEKWTDKEDGWLREEPSSEDHEVLEQEIGEALSQVKGLRHAVRNVEQLLKELNRTVREKAQKSKSAGTSKQ